MPAWVILLLMIVKCAAGFVFVQWLMQLYMLVNGVPWHCYNKFFHVISADNNRNCIDSSRPISVTECYLVYERGQNHLFARIVKIFQIFNYLWYCCAHIWPSLETSLCQSLKDKTNKQKKKSLLYFFISCYSFLFH